MRVKMAAPFRKAERKRQKEVGPGVPRVAKLMALAIRFDQLLSDGVDRNQAELAELGRVSRARVSQILALLNLAPDIQEAILFLEREPGRERVTERGLRDIVEETDWKRQRKRWVSLSVQVVPSTKSSWNGRDFESAECLPRT